MSYEEANMRESLTVIRSATICGLLILGVSIVLGTVPLLADDVQATVGAQSGDLGRQALAFLPNELWVHSGDSVTWAFPTDEPHTVTFLSATQNRPPFPQGCAPAFPPTSPSGSSYTPDTCVNSGILLGGPTYTVAFPNPGNFKLVCLLHTNMTGVVHVLDKRQPLPYRQNFYDQQAAQQAGDLLADAYGLEGRGALIALLSRKNEVTAGIGEILATGGGSQTASVMRFLQDRIIVHVGETVEFTNLDPVTPHTVTFGTEPDEANLFPPSTDVKADPDGALRAVLGSPGDSTHSGLILASPQDQLFAPQTPIPPIIPLRFRVKFTRPGVFTYICALHDDLGMKGRVVVLPRDGWRDD